MIRTAFVSGSHPCKNPRMLRAARQLADWGHQVDVFHPTLDSDLTSEDRELAATGGWNSRVYFDWDKACWTRFQARLIRKLAAQSVRLGVQSGLALGYGMPALRRLLPEIRCYDLVVGQQEAGMWAAVACIGHEPRVWIDIEDWYSRDLPASSQATRPLRLLQKLESKALNGADWCTTTSRAMARALAEEYDGRVPGVIYNVSHRDQLMLSEGQRDRTERSSVSFHWFSQTIGPHRGLELLFQAALRVDRPFEIHLRGSVESHDWLQQAIPDQLRSRVRVHGLVSNADLHSRISEHDVGLALEEPYCDNRKLTITNKLFAYIQAGLPVIATRTEGQAEILDDNDEMGVLVDCHDQEALARAMANFAGSRPDQGQSLKRSQAWCWENHASTVARQLSQWFPRADVAECIPAGHRP